MPLNLGIWWSLNGDKHGNLIQTQMTPMQVTEHDRIIDYSNKLLNDYFECSLKFKYIIKSSDGYSVCFNCTETDCVSKWIVDLKANHNVGSIAYHLMCDHVINKVNFTFRFYSN